MERFKLLMNNGFYGKMGVERMNKKEFMNMLNYMLQVGIINGQEYNNLLQKKPSLFKGVRLFFCLY